MSISEAAADWLVLIRAGEMSDPEKLAYIHWLKESPDHIREILELVSLEQLLRQTHPGPSEEAQLDEATKVIDLELPAEKCER
jgi:ferric-dicitrate binding protein FerR (iron transport regulator)